jgi:hypothetical protein
MRDNDAVTSRNMLERRGRADSSEASHPFVPAPMPRPRKPAALALTLALAALLPAGAAAHVKWFSDFSFADQPLRLPEAVTPLVLGLLALSMVVIGALVLVDRRLDRARWYQRLDERLGIYRDRSTLILRVGAGATLLLAWQGDAIFVPELEITGAWVGWYQFALALMLLSRRMTPVAGAGLIALYAYAFWPFTALHMLDYTFVAGVGFYFLVSSAPTKIKGLGLPALYLTVGFSLCWVALEKLIYPQWGLYVLEQNPQLALGFDLDFFLTGAAFVEFSLGYLLIICLLQRPFALVVTFVFFTTTLFFGKVEVIGHTLIHAALLVFIIEGPGTAYTAPYQFHKRPALRTAFASVNVALLFFVLLVPYTHLAWNVYQRHADDVRAQLYEVPAGEVAPAIGLSVQPDMGGGYLVRLDTGDLVLAPGGAHAHLYVDGRQVARLYAPVHHVELEPGTRTLTAVLATGDHRLYASGGEAIRAETTVDVPERSESDERER